jgi:hypothetical protein
MREHARGCLCSVVECVMMNMEEHREMAMARKGVFLRYELVGRADGSHHPVGHSNLVSCSTLVDTSIPLPFRTLSDRSTPPLRALAPLHITIVNLMSGNASAPHPPPLHRDCAGNMVAATPSQRCTPVCTAAVKQAATSTREAGMGAAAVLATAAAAAVCLPLALLAA